MSSPTTLQIKNVIETTLADLLGTYSWSNGQTLPSFQVEDGTQQLKEQPSVEGLEVIYQLDDGTPDYTGAYGDDYWMYRKDRVVLKQWDLAKTTLEAAHLLIPALKKVPVEILVAGARVIRGSPLENIEVNTLTFRRPTLN